MRKLVIKLLAGFRRLLLWVRRLRGKTPDDIAVQRVVSGRAWDEFCDTLKAAGASLSFPGTPQDAFNQAEGYRYLSRLARGGLMAFVEHADPKAPVLHRVANETVKLGADNPDNHYLTAAINGDYEYRIVGRRNTVTYLVFGTHVGHYGSGGLPPTGHIDGHRDRIGCRGALRANPEPTSPARQLAADDRRNRHLDRAPDLCRPRPGRTGRTDH